MPLTLADIDVTPGAGDSAPVGGGKINDNNALIEAADAANFKADGSVDMTGEFRTDVGTFDSDVANGASAVAFSFDTHNNFSTTGAKLAQWNNAGAAKFSIGLDGRFTFDGSSGAFSNGNHFRISNTDGEMANFGAGGAGIQFQRKLFFSNATLANRVIEGASSTVNNGMAIYGSRLGLSQDHPALGLTINAGNASPNAATNVTGPALLLQGGASATASGNGGAVTITGGTSAAGSLGAVNIAATGGSVGFLGATAVARQATTGTVTGFTAGSGTAAKDDSTYTGNSGTAAYTVGDIVLALKNYGLLAAS